LICHHSPFFFAAFNGNFIEGTTQAMSLDVDEKAFGVVANWFYNQVVVSETGDRLNGHFSKVWILAEGFLTHHLQNRAMDAIYALYGPFPLPEFAEFAQIGSDHSTGENPLVDFAVWSLNVCTQAFSDENVCRIPQGILVKVDKYLKKVGLEVRC
jgi:hypothetical protein